MKKKDTFSVSRRTFLSLAACGGIFSISKKSTFAAQTNPSTPFPAKGTVMSEDASEKKILAEWHARKLSSPQYKNGKFQNTIPEQLDGWRAAKSWILSGKGHREPEGPLPVAVRKASEFSSRPANDLTVSWLSHSTLLIEVDGLRFLTDPVWGQRASPLSFAGPKRFYDVPLPLQELPSLDAVVLSHDHYDHFCSETLEFFKSRDIPFLVPLGVGARLVELGIPHTRIREFDWGESIDIGKVRLVSTPARHFSGRTLFDRNSTLWCSWCFLGSKERLFFSGDTAMFPGFKDIGETYGPFDVVAMEIGAYNAAWPDVHIGPEQAAQAFLDLKGRVFLPIHWATFNLALHNWTEPGERLIVIAKKLGIDIVLPKPGETFIAHAIADSMRERWWPDVPWEKAEDSPVISTGLT